MGEICCSLPRIGASHPQIKILETKIILPSDTDEQSNKSPKIITLGVLDHVTAPQMVSFELNPKLKNNLSRDAALFTLIKSDYGGGNLQLFLPFLFWFYSLSGCHSSSSRP